MKKLLVEVISPGTGKHYDFLLPAKAQVAQAGKKIAGEIMQYEKNEDMFDLEREILLYSKRLQMPLFPGYTLEQAGVNAGDSLMIL